MGSILDAIYDDMEEYERRCLKYKEEPRRTRDVYGNDLLDCYGQHANELEEREKKENQNANR